MSASYRIFLSTILITFLSSGCRPTPIHPSDPVTEPLVSTTTSPVGDFQPTTPATAIPDIPYGLVSQESLFAYLEDLTSIQPYSGWRNSASSGEAEALDYVEKKLHEFSSLQSRGLELERQKFSVYLSTEIWDSRLILTLNGQEIEVPADGLRGSKSYRSLADYFDSDGIRGDLNPNPITADGSPVVVREDESLYTLTANELEGRILFLDYSLIDTYVNSEALSNGSQLMKLVDQGLAGVVLVTQYSNRPGESRGTLIGDGSIFLYEVPSKRVPILYIRIEDLSLAGIVDWDDLDQIETAHLVLDSDVLSPGQAGNVIACIPGADSSKAVILGAHIDSPNSPGAFDDGSGAAALLEVARVLDVSRIQPAVDVYLAWFGGHEIGTYGSAYFVSTHQELLDRTLGMIQMDGLGHPLDGRTSKITMMTTSYGRFGDDRLPMPDFLSKAVASQGLSLDQLVEYGLIADNSNFDAFNVPNVFLGYINASEWRTRGSGYIHYSNHFHDPYETVDLAREVDAAFVGMTKVMLSAALETGRAQPKLRVTPTETHRALFVASHTEAANIATSMLRELGMALAWEGFDVDLIPYGQAITRSDLKDVSIIVLPPTLDYPGKHNEKWGEAEIALLESYVAEGGLLVVTNSSCNYAIKRCLDDINEDRRSLNALLEPMGVAFMYGGGLSDAIALAITEHPLTANASYLSFYDSQGVPFRMKNGLELIRAAARPIVGLLDYGSQGGQVLVIADLGILQVDSMGAKNMEFLKNIARYASAR
jgi:hypothetical protein